MSRSDTVIPVVQETPSASDTATSRVEETLSVSDTVIPVVEETLSVSKRELVTGRIRVETVTDSVEQMVNSDLEFTTIDIERVPIDRHVDSVPEVRVEGDVTIVPVVEEVVVVEKRLLLTEEIRITRQRGTKSVETPVQVRKQRVVVTREPGPNPDPVENS